MMRTADKRYLGEVILIRTRDKLLTVVIAHEKPAVQIGARQALESDGIQVVAEAATAEDAVAVALRYRPDVCLLSTRLPGGGIFAAEEISSALPDTKVVMVSDSEDGELFDALRAGAVGWLLPTTPAARLPHAIHGVAEGQAALPRELTARLIREFRESGGRRRVRVSSSGANVDLTAREYEVLRRMKRGDQTAEIAQRLGISEVTVRRHISSIVHKLGVGDRHTVLSLVHTPD
jgi:DNA-binding NarL/FixJ family response regulator